MQEQAATLWSNTKRQELKSLNLCARPAGCSGTARPGRVAICLCEGAQRGQGGGLELRDLLEKKSSRVV